MEENKHIDMEEILKKASEMSKLFNQNQSNDKKDNNIDIENMFRIMKFINVMQQSEQNVKQNDQDHGNKKLLDKCIYFDDDLCSPEIKTIKSALPYIDYKYQKNIGIMIKFMEIQNLLSKYNDTVMMIKKKDDKNWHKNVLMAIRPHMEDKKKQMIDMIIKFIDLRDVILKLDDFKEEK